MQIKGLRLVGFKSFVEPAELVIAPGLTGVVGPNGCGKSNLLEALRWVMGETSTKSMRASAMDDVIFSGTQNRPPRNAAEVTIFLDNAARTAPAEFNDSDQIEITRRIEREAGSSYRINGKEARARDVRLLFEDAATGARSHALVRQGQIGQIINAKPEARRRILEDAAGIAGLHSRRHEAELRLKAAESNLERLADVMGQISGQRRSLERQARQARRYKALTTEIAQAEAIHHHLAWRAACAAVEAEEEGLREVLREVARASAAEAAARSEREKLAETLGPLREEEARRAAALQRVALESEALEREAEAAERNRQALEARLAQTVQDLARETAALEETREVLARLDEEEAQLRSTRGREEEEARARAALERTAADLEAAETHLAGETARLADLRARRQSLQSALADLSPRIARLAEEDQRIARALADLADAGGDCGRPEALAREGEKARGLLAQAEEAIRKAEAVLTEAREREKRCGEAHNRALLDVKQIETEIETLRRMLAPSGEGDWPPVLEQVQVDPGYELALAAALGDDLEAPLDPAAPLHWGAAPPADGDPALPAGAEPLAAHVDAPGELARRLAQVGLVDASAGAALQKALRPGQRLVSRQGDLWRWDGLTAAADAPSAAARRLEGRNRLAAAEARLAEQRVQAHKLGAEHEAALAETRTGERDLAEEREQARAARERLDALQAELAAAEREAAERQRKEAALLEGAERTRSALAEARAREQELRASLEALESVEALEAGLAKERERVGELRALHSQARAHLAGLERERTLCSERLARIGEERQRWLDRARSAESQCAALEERRAAAEAERTANAQLPGQIDQRRKALMDEIARLEAARKEAADRLAEAEGALREQDAALRAVEKALGEAREGRARIEARLEAARERRSEQARAIREAFDCAPEDCLAKAGVAPANGEEGEAALPRIEEVERRLVRLRAERERLGGVNLRAEEELAALAGELDTMEAERADLEEAIQRLRQGIAKLNREGRRRLLEAFETVNGHFKRLFVTLFGGGEAELRLIESDDPLSSGLELIARPPGKKPTVLSLLSGGEQALTALALIFAVFLTNPSPICVLDEVDAPLDDANVDRFCTMMEEMARETDTRFLVITHHPMTMARMRRLFGVTMAEKGVSQLVSVDLAAAEALREAS